MITISLEGKAALVTGSGRGIGKALAMRLAEAGAAVCVNDLELGVAEETRKEIESRGGRAIAISGDLTRPELPAELVNGTVDAFGSLDVVVNNAGYTWDNVIQKMTDEQFQAMLDIHLVAPFRILRAASGWIREAAKRETAGGTRVMRKVVNITSIAGTDGNPGQAAYSAAKAGVVGLTRTLAKEWGRYNVNVNSVGFGLIETRLVQPWTGEGSSSIDIKGNQIPVGVPPKMLESIRSSCPLGRLGTPEEAADAVLFFCSPLSDYVTGEVLICGGGFHF